MNFSGEHDRLGLTRMQASLLEPIGLGRAPDLSHDTDASFTATATGGPAPPIAIS